MALCYQGNEQEKKQCLGDFLLHFSNCFVIQVIFALLPLSNGGVSLMLIETSLLSKSDDILISDTAFLIESKP